MAVLDSLRRRILSLVRRPLIVFAMLALGGSMASVYSLIPPRFGAALLILYVCLARRLKAPRDFPPRERRIVKCSF